MKRAALWLAMLAGVCGLAGGPARAAYPVRTVRFLVGFEPGGGTDALARAFAAALAAQWHQAVVVENLPGADGSIAADRIAHGPADGYTLLWMTNSHTITPAEHKLSYDPLADFAPVANVASTWDVMVVSATSPVHSVQDLIALVKSKPGQLSFGTGGTGTLPYPEMELFMRLTGTDMIAVAYKGGGPQTLALLQGEISVAWAALATSVGQIQAGKFRPLAVTTDRRTAALPTVPTIAEAAGLQGFDTREWFGVLAAAHTAPAIVDFVHRSIVTAQDDPAIKGFMKARYFVAENDGPAAFGALMASEIAKWKTVLKQIKPATP